MPLNTYSLGFFAKVATYLVTVPLVFVVGRSLWHALYNLFLHPLAKFPGPKTAGLSEWWEVYHTIKCKHIMEVETHVLNAKKAIDSTSYKTSTKSTDLLSELAQIKYPLPRQKRSIMFSSQSVLLFLNPNFIHQFNLALDLSMRGYSIIQTTNALCQRDATCSQCFHLHY